MLLQCYVYTAARKPHDGSGGGGLGLIDNAKFLMVDEGVYACGWDRKDYVIVFVVYELEDESTEPRVECGG